MTLMQRLRELKFCLGDIYVSFERGMKGLPSNVFVEYLDQIFVVLKKQIPNRIQVKRSNLKTIQLSRTFLFCVHVIIIHCLAE